MRSTRALFASLGASVTLVAAAAFSLLTVSAVVALQGWPGLADAGARPALVVDAAVLPGIGAPGGALGSEAVVLRALSP
nr:hypothetical protein [Solirubrobacterales bacterium]